MALRVYNTLTRQKEDFQTVVPGKVGMYLCGPTVYKPAHIGHMVGPVIFDTVKRYLEYVGYDVTYVINITDVDDKLINKANELGKTVDELAKEMTQDYFDNLKTMAVETVDHFPYATDHIQEMLDIIQTLIDKGSAYPMDGDVYFEVSKDDDYGKLSRRSVEEMVAGTRVEANDRKRNSADFALWKKSRPGEPCWESPWGPGRPGWHIECSAMSMKWIGESLDIHGGGLDLMFPHHENELAQSESCTGQPFTRYWMHNGLMQEGSAAGKLGGQHDRHGDVNADKAAQEAGKLSGSKGAASVKELFEKHTPEAVRFFLLSTHYRSPIEFSDQLINERAEALEKFYRYFDTYQRVTGQDFYAIAAPKKRSETTTLAGKPGAFLGEISDLRDRFVETMDDDFNTGGGMGVLFELLRRLNGFVAEKKLDAGSTATESDIEELTAGTTVLKELSTLLGLFSKPIEKAGLADDDGFAATLMDLIIEVRATARKSKNFEIADRIRDVLNELKVTLEDRPDGTSWRRD